MNSLAAYGWLPPDGHEFYNLFKRSVKNLEMHRIFSKIQSYQLCDGVKESVGNISVTPAELNTSQSC